MADNEPMGSKPFGMGNLFFGNPVQLELPKLPATERSIQPARQLAYHMRSQPSSGDEDEEWPAEDLSDEGDGDSGPVQTEFGVYSRARRPNSPDGKVAPRRQRIEGGRAAQSKKVTADLDSDDEIIVQMKQQNYSDRDIACHLISEGRINYDKKTIATRWARLRRVLAEREDELLDEGLTDWHEGEDELLVKSFRSAELQVEHELEKVRDKLWRYTADLLRRERPTSRYSPRACKERYEALIDGTARIPPEIDDDPEARAAERATKLEAKRRQKEGQEREKQETARQARAENERRKQLREDEVAARKAKREQEDLEKKRKLFETTQERENKKKEAEQAKLDAKLYEQRTRQEQKLRKEQAAARKLQEAEKARQNREAAAQLKEQKDLELRQMKEAQARAKLEAIQKGREIKERQQQVRRENRSRAQSGKTKVIDDNNEDENSNDPKDELPDTEDVGKCNTKEAGSVGGPSAATASLGHNAMTSSSNNPTTLDSTKPKPTSSSGVEKVSPRKSMSTQELVTLLQKRGVKVNSKTSRKYMISQLALLDSKTFVEDLKLELKNRGLKQTGNKAELVHRLATDDAAKSSNAQSKTPSKPLAEVRVPTEAAECSSGLSTPADLTPSTDIVDPIVAATNEGNNNNEAPPESVAGDIYPTPQPDVVPNDYTEAEHGESMDTSA